MKKLIIILILFITANSYAKSTAIKQCESLESRNQQLIKAQKQVSLCLHHLSESKKNISLACDSIAVNRFNKAKEALAQSYAFLNEARKDHCNHHSLVVPLRNDVQKFKNSL